jgi:hypothetical protein
MVAVATLSTVYKLQSAAYALKVKGTREKRLLPLRCSLVSHAGSLNPAQENFSTTKQFEH